MTISFDKALGIHQQALQVRSQRAQVLANNLANIDTPNYKARDVDFKGILQGEAQLSQSKSAMRVTDNQHIVGQSLSSDNSLLYRIPQQPSIDGNTVEEQIEHSAYMENNLAFQTSFTFLNKKFTGLMRAIKGE
ncbi:MAG: flagellar basal body rod protein FlgB [Cellvibrionaceae bacterium]